MTTETSNSFAIKFRPKVFSDFVGQDTSMQILKGMFKRKKIARSILIYGDTGCGKTSLGRLIARYVNCQKLKKRTPCGKCASCKRNIEDHPDFHEINMGDKTGVEFMRGLTNTASYSPQSNFRIFLLDELHAITSSSKSAFLKPLEEPPPRTIWIGATTNPEKLPETISGRCLKIHMKSVEPKDTVKLLSKVCKEESIELSSEILLQIAQLCRGQPRDSLQSLEVVANFIKGKKVKKKDIKEIISTVVKDIIGYQEDIVIKFLLSIYAGKYTTALKSLEEISSFEPFVRSLIDYHINAIYLRVSPKLRSNFYGHKRFFKHLGEYDLEGLHNKQMFDILDILIEAGGKIKQYVMDNKQIMISTTFKCIDITSTK